MKIGNYIGKEPDEFLYKEDEKLVSNSDAVGVELEMENIIYSFTKNSGEVPVPSRFASDNPLPSLGNFWKVIKDGSLRKGTEFIFSVPHKGANITAALDKMQTFIDAFSYRNEPIKITDRCSVHVHLDVRDLDNEEVSNFILLYIFIERVLFLNIDISRVKNNYCKPLTNSSFKYILSELIKKSGDEYDSIERFVRAIREQCDKYSALNILPVSTYGSVEFRHHQGTTDMSEVKRWINIILALKLASKTTIKDWIEIYTDKGYKETLSLIFKNTYLGTEEFLNKVEVEGELFKGLMDTREVLSLNELSSLSNRKKARVRPVNTLLHQFKIANNLEVTE